MNGRRSDGQRSVAQAYVWAARVTNVALTGVIPPLLGYWADSAWRTKPWCLIVGGGLGFAMFFSELLRLSGGSTGAGSGSATLRKPRSPLRSTGGTPGEPQSGADDAASRDGSA